MKKPFPWIIAASALAVAAIAAALVAWSNRLPETPASLAPASAPVRSKTTIAVSEAPIPAAYRPLAETYGEDRARQAIELSGQATTLAADIMQSLVENLPQLQEQTDVESFATLLELDESQIAALQRLMAEAAPLALAEAQAFTREPGRDQKEVAETILAADAFSRGEVTREQFDTILSRTAKPMLEGKLTTLEAIHFLGPKEDGQPTDPFSGADDFAGKFMSILTPSQAENYEKLRHQRTDPANLEITQLAEGKSTSLDDFALHLKEAKKLKDLMSLFQE